MPSSADRIFIEGLSLFARHGVEPGEAELGQRFRFDIELGIDLRAAGKSDQLSDTVDYGAVVKRVAAAAAARRCRLLEALAAAIVDDLFAAYPPITSIRLRIHKPAAPVPEVFNTVGIEVYRTR